MQPFFKRRSVEVALDTDIRLVAEQRAYSFSLLLDDLWLELARSDMSDAESRYKQTVQNAKLLGFTYQPMSTLVTEASSAELTQRILATSPVPDDPVTTSALGLIDKPRLTLSKALDEFFKHELPDHAHKSPLQLRKWKVPRRTAMQSFINVVGDKALETLGRDDMLRYRQWWIDRIDRDGLSPSTANKQFTHIKRILETAIDNFRLDVPIDALFRKIKLKQIEKNPRASFDPNFVQELLLGEAMDGMNFECRMLVFAMADTGARISELVGLEDTDVILHPQEDKERFIPHIRIRPNGIRHLKTKQSQRDLPLVGSSLFAFQQLQGGFKHYQGKADTISSTLNKYCRENNVFPSAAHSLYSLRHCFEDRLTAVEPPDKLQAALMGHAYHRPRYGKGPRLEQKKHWLEKIAFRVR